MLLELDMAAEPFEKRCRSCVSSSVSRQAETADSKHYSVNVSPVVRFFSGVDETRTRGLLRDRQAL